MSKLYRCIMADPPWSFDDRGNRAAPSYQGEARADARYRVTGLAELMSMGHWVQRVTAPDAFLWLWAPGAIVLDGQAARLAKAWGFTPVQLGEWIKTDAAGHTIAMGMGHYMRLSTEPFLLCRRGKAQPKVRNERNVIFAPRTKHSAKPDEAYHKAERLCEGPYIEMFARRRWSDAWDVWGDEAPIGAVA